jgi:hypothetical protein
LPVLSALACTLASSIFWTSIENTQISAPICLGTGLNVYSYNSPLHFKMRS